MRCSEALAWSKLSAADARVGLTKAVELEQAVVGLVAIADEQLLPLQGTHAS